MPLNIKDVQKETGEWRKRNFPGDDKPEWAIMGVVEEVGELAHAMLKLHQGIRGEPAFLMDSAKDAIGDIIIYLFDVCNRMGVDMEDIITTTWDTVKRRDWQQNRQDGKVE